MQVCLFYILYFVLFTYYVSYINRQRPLGYISHRHEPQEPSQLGNGSALSIALLAHQSSQAQAR